MPKKNDNCRSDCPIANALDLLGDRWSLVVLRDMIFQGRREFGEFLKSGEGIATNILTDRLDRLCTAGVVARFEHPTDGKKYVYRVTERGIDLIPTLVELILWGAKHLPHIKVPADRLRPFVEERDKTVKAIRESLLEEIRSSGKPIRK